MRVQISKEIKITMSLLVSLTKSSNISNVERVIKYQADILYSKYVSTCSFGLKYKPPKLNDLPFLLEECMWNEM